MTYEIEYQGDKQAALRLKMLALKQRGILREHMAFRDLKQCGRRLDLDDGSIIHVSSWFGHDRIQVYSPPLGSKQHALLLEEDSPDFTILLVQDTGDYNAELWLYNHEDDEIADALGVSNLIFPERADPFFNNFICHLDNKAASIGNTVELEAEGLEPDLTTLAYDYATEVKYLKSAEGSLHRRNIEDISAFVDVLDPTFWTYSAASGKLLHLGGHRGSVWNKYSGMELWNIGPSVPIFGYQYSWVPGVFYAEPGNGMYQTGLWYGPRGFSARGPASKFEVTFGELLDCRESYPIGGGYGYCETLTKQDTTDLFIVNFFVSIDHPSTPPNTSISMASVAGYQYGGNDLQPGGPAFSIDCLAKLGPLFGVDPEIHFWRGRTYTVEETGAEIGLGGAIVSHNGKAVVQRVTAFEHGGDVGFTQYDLGLIENYHSHSVSNDGSMLAVFTGAEGVITGCKVFDIEKNEQIQDSELVSQASASLGCWIGPEESRKNVSYLQDARSLEATTDTVTFLPQLGGITYGQSLASPADTWKITCDDGVHAVAAVYDDYCFESTMIKVTPSPVDATGPFSLTVEGEQYSADSIAGLALGCPYVLYSYTGGEVAPHIVFAQWTKSGNDVLTEAPNITGSSNLNIEILELADLVLMTYEDMSLYAGNALGGVNLPSTYFDETGAYTGDNPDCQDNVDTITTGCGQSGEITIPVGPDPLEVSGGAVSVGTFISSSGGKPPHSYSISCGSIDEDTGEITDLSGCCGTGTVTVTDDCGEEATAQIYFPSGQWVLSDEVWGDPCDRYGMPGTYTSTQTCYDGAYKHVYTVGRAYCPGGASACASVLPYCDSCVAGVALYDNPCTGVDYNFNCWPVTEEGHDTSEDGDFYYKIWHKIYTWDCP